MKEQDLFRAMTDIEDEYILEAAPDEAGKIVIPFYKRPAFRVASGVAAACLVAVIGIGTWRMTGSGFKNLSSAPDANAPVVEEEMEPAAPEEAGEAMEIAAGEAAEDAAKNEKAREAAKPDGSSGNQDDDAMYMTEMETETESVTEASSEEETNTGSTRG